MNIYIVGLGLIGGSFARALNKYAQYTVYGWDTCGETRESAAAAGAIAAALPPEAPALADIELVLIALPPAAAVETAKKLFTQLRPGTMVIDLCGIKENVVAALAPTAAAAGIRYIGGHPMAGREISGFAAAKDDLYAGASMLLCPGNPEDAGGESGEVPPAVREMLTAAGFSRIITTTAAHHDKVIAFTSQLPHLISAAYVQSETAPEFRGYAAGSFRDLSRVAGVDPILWTELFCGNRSNIVNELDSMLAHLTAFRQAIANEDREELRRLLAEASKCKKELSES